MNAPRERERSDPESAARFTRRLESFSDLVFGLSLSLAAARLIVPPHAADIFAKPFGLVAFVTTFAAIAGLWLGSHRSFELFFEPSRIDVAAVFVRLMGVAVMPYALQTVLTFSLVLQPLLLYNAVFILILAANSTIAVRGYLRHAAGWSFAKRRRAWRIVCMLLALVVAFAIDTGLALYRVSYGWNGYFLISLAAVLSGRLSRIWAPPLPSAAAAPRA